jgi:hypothetical protein
MDLSRFRLLPAALLLLLAACRPVAFTPLLPIQVQTPIETSVSQDPGSGTAQQPATETAVFITTPAVTETYLPQVHPTYRPSSTPLPSPTATPETLGVFNFPADVNPLTGLKVSDPSMLDRRPVLVKVSNYPRYGRPHAGLSDADMVFEYYIGEEANRFLALFYSKDSKNVGPVRSGRLVDGPLTNMYGGILAYGDADPQVDGVLLREIGERAMAFSNYRCPVFCGNATHSVAGVFANTAELSKVASDNGVGNSRQDLHGMIFGDRLPLSSKPASNVAIQYSIRDRGEWRYDPGSQTYLRWIENGALDSYNHPVMEPLTDRNNGDQIAFSNIIIIFTTYIEYAPTLHDIMIWKNTGSQRAIFFRDGVMVEGTWRAPYYDHPMQFFSGWGNPMALKPGTTWIVIAGNHSLFNQTSPGQWEMRFDLP